MPFILFGFFFHHFKLHERFKESSNTDDDIISCMKNSYMDLKDNIVARSIFINDLQYT